MPAHHQTLRGAIAWSYGLLSAPEQRLFAWLGAFAGPWTLDAALALEDEPGAVAREERRALLFSLVDKNLVQRFEHDGASCFRMLETMREYALEQLDAGGEATEVRWRHARYYLALAEQAESGLLSAAQARWQARLEWELDNLRAALEWACGQGQAVFAMRLASALRSFWAHGQAAEGRRWLLLALRVGAQSGAPLLDSRGRAARAKALCCLGTLLFEEGQVEAAGQALDESLQLYRQLGDRAGRAMALLHLCRVYACEERFEDALLAVETSLVLYRELGDRFGISYVLNIQGTTLMALACKQPGTPLFFEQLARAERLYASSLALCEETGQQAAAIAKLVNLGSVRFLLADQAGARRYYERALQLSQGLRHKRGVAIALFELGLLAYYQQDDQQALAICAEALGLFRGLGHTLGIVSTVVIFAALAWRSGNARRAALLCGWVRVQAGHQVRFMRTAELYEELGMALRSSGAPPALDEEPGSRLSLDEVLASA
jgi:tetratricopeptide (TPR) repeat protein